MKSKITKLLWQVLGVGILAGIRTSSAPVIAGEIISNQPKNKKSGAALKFMQSDIIANIFRTMAIGELIVDKLSSTPNRIKPAGLIFRCISGAIAGGGIFKATGNNPATGAIIGGGAALVSTFGSFYLRKATVKGSGIVDPVIGAIEDAFVVGAGIGLIKIT